MKKEFESSWMSHHVPQPCIKPGQVFFIIWNPEGETPPSKKFARRENAQMAAEDMAKRFRGQEFFVLEAKSCSAVDGVKTTELS